ncbi:MAG: M3 family oligoendopeptidase [Holosporales bacterium]|jgi:oligoendopeptidase F|nr:M3 family oligoendopeptidase [Holosporales bacterium]
MPATWCLEDIYKSPDDRQLGVDRNSVQALAMEFKSCFRGKILPENLSDAIAAYEKIAKILIRLESYAFLCLQTNLNNEKILSFYRYITEFVSNTESSIVFFKIEISKLDEIAVMNACSENPVLAKYKSWLLNCFKYKEHLLADETEEALFQKQLTANDAWIRLYDELLARLEFVFDGESKRLPEIIEIANHSATSETREKASKTISEKLTEAGFYINHIYCNILLDRAIDDRLRKYDKPESFRHLENNIGQDVVDFLADTVTEQYATIAHKYYRLKSYLMKKKQLEYWDRNAQINLSGFLEKKFEYHEATRIVLETFGAFSDTFGHIARDFIEKRWIDVYPKDGKASGAFSHSCSTDIHPYILLNYFDSMRDVFTLAHELGHGIHQTLSGKENGPLLAATPITLSEVASLFAEKLLFEKLFESSASDLEKIDLLCSRLDNTINTVIRQIAFFKFERAAHEARRTGEFSTQALSEIFIKTQRECLGEFVNVDDCISCYWCYISHFFHAPFYVYAYSFGEIFVNALFGARQIMGNPFVEKYTRMLSRGGIDSYDVAASEFGLNPLKVEFWRNGVQSIADQVEYLEALCDYSVAD